MESHRTTTVKTTEVRSSAESEAPTMTYRPSVNARTVVIQRSSYGGVGASSTSSSRERSTSYGGANIPSGAYALVSSTGVNAVKTSREQEKKDMQDLNERFASYIEKVNCHSYVICHVLSTAKFYLHFFVLFSVFFYFLCITYILNCYWLLVHIRLLLCSSKINQLINQSIIRWAIQRDLLINYRLASFTKNVLHCPVYLFTKHTSCSHKDRFL